MVAEENNGGFLTSKKEIPLEGYKAKCMEKNFLWTMSRVASGLHISASAPFPSPQPASLPSKLARFKKGRVAEALLENYSHAQISPHARYPSNFKSSEPSGSGQDTAAR